MINDQLNWQKDNFENIEKAWEGDLWDRKRLGLQLERYVDRLQCGAVLALDARWGEGKTWFVRHWAKHLSDTEHNVIYLDAFANDYLDDPFLVITSEIANVLKKDKSTSRKINKLIQLSASVGTVLLPSLPKVALTLGLHLVGAGLIGTALQQGYESAKDEIEKLSDEASERIKESIQEKIATHEAEKKTLIEFKKHLAETVEKLDKPLVFIIDELDRCRPDFSIRLIERIKHFFDIPKIVFVLVVHKDNLAQTIKSNYGYTDEGEEKYLDKFIDFEIPLPQINKFSPQEVISIPVLKKLFENIGELSDDVIFLFYKSLQNYMSPREIKKKINIYALLRTGIIKKDMFLILTLQIKGKNLVKYFTELKLSLESEFQQCNISRHNVLNYFKKKYTLEPIELVELLKGLREVEHTTYAFSNGEDFKKQKILEIYSQYSINSLNDLNQFSQQFTDYVNVHLWGDLISDKTNQF